MPRSLAILVTLAFAASACASDSAGTTTTGAAVDTAVPEALQFTAPLVGGGEFDGFDLAHRPVAFWFWAPT